MHLECNYFLYANASFLYNYIVHTVMEWVAFKPPMPLQTQDFYIFFCICNGILPGVNAITALCLKHFKICVDHKSWQIPRALPVPLASEKAFSPVYSMVICCVTADIMADILLPVLMTVGKLKLCQYKFIMETRRAHNQAKETLKQPYQTIVSTEWLPCLSQQVTMKYAKKKKISRLLEQGQ